MTIVFLLILFATAITASYYNKDIFSPIRIYICIYALLLAINALHLSGLQTPWALTTHLLFWGASFFFIAGSTIIILVNRINNPHAAINFASIQSSVKISANATDWKWFFKIWLLCTLLFFASYLASFLITGIVPVFSEDPDTARIKFLSASLLSNMGIFLGPLSLALATELWFFGALKGRNRLAIVIFSVVTLVLYLSLVTRFDLFRFILFAIILLHYGRKKLSFGTLCTALALSLVLFFAFFLLRLKSNSLSMVLQMHKLKIPKDFVWCSNIYAYVVCNFWNMDFAIRKFVDGTAMHPHGWGFDLFRPFLWIAQLESTIAHGYGFDTIMNESVQMVKSLNTIAYPWHFFKDFGVFGVYFLPLFFGMLITIFYVNTVNSPTLFNISMWALLAPFILFSYAIPLWEFWFPYLYFLIMAIAHKRIRIAT